ncbi:MAG: glycosyltransferase, partial [Flavitalea sp.]
MADPGRPFFSICIPAYKNPGYLKRLLDSLSEQTFRDFELIISDDSPDESISELIAGYTMFPSVVYFKNAPALGTPANWNAGIRKARGEWIKLMHDDDWFASPKSLELFAKAVKANKDASFIFSAYKNVNAEDDKVEPGELIRPESFRLKQTMKNPVSLLSKNIIGPPSVTIHKNDQQHFYDPALKWLVDMDFYIRFLNDGGKVSYIDEPLINIGISALQVTKSSSLVREVEIP